MDPAQQAFFDHLANNTNALVQQMMQTMQATNAQLITELMGGVMGKKSHNSMVGARGVGQH